jgi:hypothetical protein
MSSVGTPPRALQGGSCIGRGVTTTTGTHLQAVALWLGTAARRRWRVGLPPPDMTRLGYRPGGYSARSTRAGLSLAADRAGQ